MSNSNSHTLGYTKESVNKDGKAQRHVVKETPTQFTLKIPAFTDKGKTLVGFTNRKLFKVNEEGFEAFKATVTQDNLKDLNRQIITDARNNLARSFELKAIIAKVKANKATPAEIAKVFSALAKSNPEMAKEAQKLVAKVV
jgi:hypothetical protein